MKDTHNNNISAWLIDDTIICRDDCFLTLKYINVTHGIPKQNNTHNYDLESDLIRCDLAIAINVKASETNKNKCGTNSHS